jgi:ribosomal protein S18 acetylase RimI-like enzyme
MQSGERSSGGELVLRSLALATDLDVLPLGNVVIRRPGYLVVRSPSNPQFFWGNLLLFDSPPGAGDGGRWETVFDEEFGEVEGVEHRTFAWDRIDGELGTAYEEFGNRGYTIDESVGLVATPDDLRPHPRENRDVVIVALDPTPGADEHLWQAVVELQTANRDEVHDEESYFAFSQARLRDIRALLNARRGAWFVALDGPDGPVAGSCGVVVTGDRGRFQTVDTALAYRRRGICSRLVVEAARMSADRYGATQLVIVADVNYHALGLYESLGFRRAERVVGMYLRPELVPR